MGENAAAFDILFYSFTMDVPRAEICCEIGRLFMEKKEYVTAAYWYQQAFLAPRKKKNGGFYIADSHDFIPAIQMCVCLDKAGRHREAFEFHKKARVLKLCIRQLLEMRSISGMFGVWSERENSPVLLVFHILIVNI